MKNREPRLKLPTTAELYALERAAKKARAAEVARLLSSAARSAKSLFAASGERKELTHA